MDTMDSTQTEQDNGTDSTQTQQGNGADGTQNQQDNGTDSIQNQQGNGMDSTQTQQGNGAGGIQTEQSNRPILDNKYLPYLIAVVSVAIIAFAFMFCYSMKYFKENDTPYIIFAVIMGCIFALAVCFIIYLLGQVIVADINSRGD